MKWEYCFTKFSNQRDWVANELNKLGNDEWEAVAVMADGDLLMKRPKPPTQYSN
jgi:hypothetical protein